LLSQERNSSCRLIYKYIRLIILALEDFAARRKKKAFEEAMDRMGADPEILVASQAVNGDFEKAERDGVDADD
jgi:hypothetical protein